jgi:hypothetical protein
MKQIFLLLMMAAVPLQAQTPTETVNVFLDCDRCDRDFMRTEITYVNWVRDRAVADVHVLVSDEDTGGGGDRYTVTFTGLRTLAAIEDTLVYTSSTNDTNDEIRRGLTRTITIGLVPYVARTRLGMERLHVSWRAPEGGGVAAAAPQKQNDPWNFWVFTLGLNSYFNGEESQNFLNWRAELEANRTTVEFKTELEFSGSFDRSSFTLQESNGTSRKITSTQEYYNAEALAVKSLGSHWSAGLQSEVTRASFANIDVGFVGGPAVEYSLWPYAEATRRSLVARYSVGVRSNEYAQRTIYNKITETHAAHTLTGEMKLKQRWGSLNTEARYSQYLHDTQFSNLFTYASANVRLFKGFSVNFFGSYSRVRDQLSLPQEELTPEEVLLRQQELSTGYRYFGGVGVSYSFGSIFNNVVNPRFN